MLYQCRLIHKGLVKENLFREGDSAQEVREALEMFDYGKGEWEIEEPEDDDEDEDFYDDEE